jgi:8-oxo-dGTP pyrophosphatase MutT (NUDIX family)
VTGERPPTASRIAFAGLAAGLVELPAELPDPPPSIQARLLLGRPGAAPLPRLPGGPPRDGAVLVLIHPGADGEAHVVLTERATGPLRHSGEISLPGGAVERTDGSPEAAAVREAVEEIGLDVEQAGMRLVGRLSTVDVRVSGFRLIPVLALADREPLLRPDPREVAAIVDAPLSHFLPDAPVEIVEEERGGVWLRYGAYPVAGYRVWGATARVLGQLGAIVSSTAG